MQEVGDEIKKESEEKREAVFEYGEIPEGKEEQRLNRYFVSTKRQLR